MRKKPNRGKDLGGSTEEAENPPGPAGLDRARHGSSSPEAGPLTVWGQRVGSQALTRLAFIYAIPALLDAQELCSTDVSPGPVGPILRRARLVRGSR